MDIISSELTRPDPVRRITLELPESRAKVLARVIDDGLVWSETETPGELSTLYAALNR